MSENVLLKIGATFGKSVAKDLQRELDALSKQLHLTIKDVSLAGTKMTSSTDSTTDKITKSQKKQMDSIDKLINRYKSMQITYEQFQKYGRSVIESDKFKEKSLDKQAKLYSALESSAKKYHQVLATEQKFNDAITKQNNKSVTAKNEEINSIEKLHGEALEMNKKFDTQKYQQLQKAIKAEESLRERQLQYEQKTRRALDKIANEEIATKSKLAMQNQQKFNSWMTSTGSSNLPTAKTSMFNVSASEAKGRNQQFESSFIPNLHGVSKSAKESAKVFEDAFASGNITTKMKKMEMGFKDVSKSGYEFGNMLETGWKKMAVWSIAATAFYLPIRALQDMIGVLTEVDSQLIEINKVLDLNKDELKQLTADATNVGIAYGRTTVEVLKATAAFAKAGLGKEEAQNLGKLALLLANVGDISVETAEETLIAANAGFQLNNSYGSLLGVIDKFNAIANQNATEVKDMAAAWEVSASTAKMAGLSIDQYNALIGTAQSTTQRSGSEIGNAWKTILMRMQGVSDGMETLDEDISKAEEALNSVGIAARNSEKEFRPAMDVLQELSNKFDELSSVEKSYVTEALAGKYRANILKSTLQNFNMVNKQIIESANASGSALKENTAYLEGIEAKTKRLSASWEQFSTTFASSDAYKGMIDFLINVTQSATRVIEVLGGLNTILITVGTVLLTKFLISLSAVAVGESVLTATTVGLSLAFQGLHASLLALLSNPVTWIIAAIGTIAVGTITWINNTKKLEEQTKSVTTAQNNFNASVDKFNRTLDSGAIAEMREEVEKLKKALDYDETIKKIDELEKKLEKVNKTASHTALPAVLKKQISELKDSLKPATDAMDIVNKKIEDNKVINIEAQKAQVNKTVATIKEIEQDKKLVKEYEDLLKSGKDEVSVRDQLLGKYPQFLTRLSEYGDRLGINTGKLNDYLNIQQKVQRAEIVSSQVAMKASMEKTKQLVSDTKAIMTLRKVELAMLYGTDERENRLNKIVNDPNADIADKYFAQSDLRRITTTASRDARKQASSEILEYEKTIDQLNSNLKYQGDFINLNPDDVIKAYGTVAPGYTPPKKDTEGSSIPSDMDTSKYDIGERDRLFRYQQILDDKSNLLEQNQAEQQKPENQQFVKKIELLKQEKQLLIDKRKALNDIAWEEGRIARERKADLEANGIKFDTNGYIDEASYDAEVNAKSAEFDLLGTQLSKTKDDDARKAINDRRAVLKQHLDNLKQWFDEYYKYRSLHNKHQIDLSKEQGEINKKDLDMEKAKEDFAKQQMDIAQEKLDAITSTEKLIQDMIKKGVDKQKELYEEDLENYRKVTDDKIDELERGWAAQDFNKDIKEQTDKRQLLQNEINILSLDTSFGGKSRVRELKKQLAEMDVKIADDQEKRKRELVKQSLEDSLKDKEDDIDEKKKFLDKEFSDEKVAALSRESLLKGSFDNLTALLPNFFTNLTISTNQSFLGIMKEYQSKFGVGISNVKAELEKVMKTAEMAQDSMGQLAYLNRQANIETYISQEEKDKAKIGEYQNEFYRLDPMVKGGAASKAEMDRYKFIQSEAQKLRDAHKWDWEDLRGYKAKAQTLSLVGSKMNGGMNTRGGVVQLHGTEARPEWVFNSDQMNNFIRNMISGTSGYTPAMAGSGGINLSININGNADSSTITGIKNAGMNILSQIKKSINKNGVGNS